MPESRSLRRIDGWSKQPIGHFCEDSPRTQWEKSRERVFHGPQPWYLAHWRLLGLLTRGCGPRYGDGQPSWQQLAQRGEERKEGQAAEAAAAWWQASLLRAQGQSQATWWPRHGPLPALLVGGTYCPPRIQDQESAGRGSDPHGQHLHKYYLQLAS